MDQHRVITNVVRRLNIVAVTVLLVVSFILFGSRESLATGGCPDIPDYGGESINYFMTDKVTGNSISDGAILPTRTALNLDALATAYGHCDVWFMDCSPCGPDCCRCVFGVRQERVVAKITYGMYATTSGAWNGSYVLGYTFGKDPVTGQVKDYHELDSRNHVNSTGGVSLDIME